MTAFLIRWAVTTVAVFAAEKLVPGIDCSSAGALLGASLLLGIINAFKGIASKKSTGLGAVAGGISEALVTTAIGLFVAIPAVMMFNYFNGRMEAFTVEMGNSSSELVDYFIKRMQKIGAKH